MPVRQEVNDTVAALYPAGRMVNPSEPATAQPGCLVETVGVGAHGVRLVRRSTSSQPHAIAPRRVK